MVSQWPVGSMRPHDIHNGPVVLLGLRVSQRPLGIVRPHGITTVLGVNRHHAATTVPWFYEAHCCCSGP